MEGVLEGGSPVPEHSIQSSDDADWSEVVRVDRLAFDGFWRMSQAGLLEAMRTTPRSVVLHARFDRHLAGYALVGSQMSLSFLQRVAVAPGYAGRGVGASLVRSALQWALRSGARVMVLNLRPENFGARRLYEREGFKAGDTALQLLRFEA
jgi:GNAT superfamily N-acetyltransferase